MKKLNIVASLVLLTIGLAFAGVPVPGAEVVTVPGIGDVLQIPFGQLFGQMAALVAALNLVGAAARHWLRLGGLALYSVILAVGAVAGAAGQVAGLLTVADYVTLVSPLGGISYGFAAGLQAVALNQGKRLVSGQSSAPQEPTPVSPQSNLPKAG